MKHSEAEKVGVLFVCMGNICRSPTADAIFNHHVKSARLEHLFHIDSAGTHAYHIGELAILRQVMGLWPLERVS